MKSIPSTRWVVLSWLVLSLSFGTAHGGGIFVQFPGLTGSSVDSHHLGWSEASDLSVGIAHPPSLFATAAKLIPLKLTKPVDLSSPGLLRALGAGFDAGSITVHYTIPGEAQITVLSIKLEGPEVQHLSTGSSSGVASTAVETVELVCKRLTYTATQLDSRGRAVLDTSLFWDLRANQAQLTTNSPAATVLTGTLNAAGQWQVSWRATAGRAYDLLSSDSIMGPYTLVQTFAPNVDGDIVYVSLQLGPPFRFYRVSTRVP